MAAAPASVSGASMVQCHRPALKCDKGGYISEGRALRGVKVPDAFRTEFSRSHLRRNFSWAKYCRRLWLIPKAVCRDLIPPISASARKRAGSLKLRAKVNL